MTQNNPSGIATVPATDYSGNSAVHESSHLHVSGTATFVDDIVALQGTLHLALGLSSQAHAKVLELDLAPVRAMPGVKAVLTAKDIIGNNDCGPIVHDDPVLADGLVQYVGQPLFAVIADTHDNARRAARKANVRYEALPAYLNALEARAAGLQVIPPMTMQTGDASKALQSAPHTLKGTFACNGQEQFYLEGQISYAIPKEDGTLHVHCSTQHPSEMQMVIGHFMHLPSHKVLVESRRMGGGFGGKESQSALFACIAALAAHRLQRPVKVRLDRDDDMLITGKRHGFHYAYEVGFDDTGRIVGAKLDMTLDCGFSADLSGPVAGRALCHFDNAYYLSDVHMTAYCAKTNKQSNTAFRGFGGPQGALVMEVIQDHIARQLKLDALAVRRANFYGTTDRNVTPYGQVVEDNVIQPLMDALVASSDYTQRHTAIQAFNASSPVLKKGLGMTPVKFGISFNVPAYNQAGALVHIYRDGSILVNHGGTEMGQGLNTKVAQVVAHALGVPLAQVRCTATDTSKIANTSATAASTGADLNGKAAQDAALTLRKRLVDFLVEKWQVTASHIQFKDGQVRAGEHTVAFADLVEMAYWSKIQLWSDGFYFTPGVHWDREKMQGHPFYYFAYGASIAEVLIDTLSGEYKILRADVLHDCGNSLNPALDLGQVEGGFVQGTGWLTSEELLWNAQGKLTTHAPSTYKIPAVSDYPLVFNVQLFQNQNVQDTIHRSKAVGEPPLLHGFSVFNALRDAVASVSQYALEPQLNAPATPEAVLMAVMHQQGQAA